MNKLNYPNVMNLDLGNIIILMLIKWDKLCIQDLKVQNVIKWVEKKDSKE